MNTQAPLPPSGTAPGDAPPAAPAGGPSGLPGAEFFDQIRGLGVVRPDRGRWAAGVCAGLAYRWGLDPLLVRGLFVVISVVGGFGLALYGALWLFLPHQDGRIHAQQVLRGVVTAGFVGSVIAILCDLPLQRGSLGWNAGGLGFAPFGGLTLLALIGVGIWWFVTRGPGRSGPGGSGGVSGPGAPGTPSSGSPHGAPPSGYGTPPSYGTPGSTGYGTPGSTGYGTPTSGGQSYGPAGYSPQQPWSPPLAAARPPRPVDPHAPSHALTRSTLGVALIAATSVLLLDRIGSGLPGPAGLIATAVALGVIALGIVLAGSRGRRSGGLAPIAIVLTLIAVGGAAAHDSIDRGYARQTWTPVDATTAQNGYRLSAGRAVLDLTRPGLVSGATTTSPITVPVDVGAGEVVVIVPSSAATDVTANVGLGDVTDRVGSQGDRGGAGVTVDVTHGGTPVLVVQVRVGLGHIEIVPQGTEVQR